MRSLCNSWVFVAALALLGEGGQNEIVESLHIFFASFLLGFSAFGSSGPVSSSVTLEGSGIKAVGFRVPALSLSLILPSSSGSSKRSMYALADGLYHRTGVLVKVHVLVSSSTGWYVCGSRWTVEEFPMCEGVITGYEGVD